MKIRHALAGALTLPLLSIGLAGTADAATHPFRCGNQVSYGTLPFEACTERKDGWIWADFATLSVRIHNNSTKAQTVQIRSWGKAPGKRGGATATYSTKSITIPARHAYVVIIAKIRPRDGQHIQYFAQIKKSGSNYSGVSYAFSDGS